MASQSLDNQILFRKIYKMSLHNIIILDLFSFLERYMSFHLKD
jgi:hypothetical protein